MSFIVDKFRATTTSDAIYKSIYIYMNQRSFRRAAKEIKNLEEYTKTEVEELEKELVELIETGGRILAPFEDLIITILSDCLFG